MFVGGLIMILRLNVESFRTLGLCLVLMGVISFGNLVVAEPVIAGGNCPGTPPSCSDKCPGRQGCPTGGWADIGCSCKADPGV